MKPVTRLFAPRALLDGGWARDVAIAIGGNGTIEALVPGAAPADAELARGPVIPGMPNLHSHAFQRAMAGRAEHRAAHGAADDSFWTWREAMYALAARVAPDDVEAIARLLYVELLERGYTSVAEFHYVHRDPAGNAYADPAEMALAHVRAAQAAGMALTLLPVLYAHAGFGPQPLRPGQRRFASTPEDVLRIAERVRDLGAPDLRAGVAAHSLRAVSPPLLEALVAGIARDDPAAPIHIHIAEQAQEVADCLAWSGARPVQWLLDHAPVDAHWCLVHATHLDDAEVARLAPTGAVAGLCPTTEANLGDGLFPLADFLRAGGRVGVGSDSHVSRDPVEELRWLEYGQRLRLQTRCVAASDGEPSVGGRLWRAAAGGGARALGIAAGAIGVGRRADLVVLDGDHVDLAGRDADHVLDALVFSGGHGIVRDVMVGGRWVVRDRRHPRRDEAIAAYVERTRRA